MKNILVEYLKKLGVKDYSELTDLERKTYEEWEKTLSTEVRIEEVAKFLETQVKKLQRVLKEHAKLGEDREALYTVARIENYEAIITFIKEPLERRKSLERELLNNIS